MGMRDFGNHGLGRSPFGGTGRSPRAQFPGFRFVKGVFIVGLIWVLIVLTFVLGILYALFVESTGGSSGRHTVYISAVEDEDNLVWDATLAYVKTSPQTTQEEKYCVNDPRVRKLLEEAAASQKPVVVYYQNDFFMMKWECVSGMSIIYRVVPVQQEEGGSS